MRNKAEHYKGQKPLLSRIQDWVSQAEHGYAPVATPFLNEEEIEIVKRTCGNKIPFYLDGGNDKASRAKVVFLSQAPWKSDVVCLIAEVRTNFVQLNHRDLLGALLNLKIERNQLGDMWVEKDRVILYTSARLAPMIIQECTKINRLHLQFELSSLRPEQEVKTEKGTGFIKSERLDSMVSCLAKKSRAEAVDMILSQQVLVNHQLVDKPSKVCSSGNILSIRGVGRFTYKGIVKVSRKDRLMIEYEKLVG